MKDGLIASLLAIAYKVAVTKHVSMGMDMGPIHSLLLTAFSFAGGPNHSYCNRSHSVL